MGNLFSHHSTALPWDPRTPTPSIHQQSSLLTQPSQPQPLLGPTPVLPPGGFLEPWVIGSVLYCHVQKHPCCAYTLVVAEVSFLPRWTRGSQRAEGGS